MCSGSEAAVTKLMTEIFGTSPEISYQRVTQFCGSASRMVTRYPLRASSVARRRTAVVLPAPPLVFAKVITAIALVLKWVRAEDRSQTAPRGTWTVNALLPAMVNKTQTQ